MNSFIVIARFYSEKEVIRKTKPLLKFRCDNEEITNKWVELINSSTIESYPEALEKTVELTLNTKDSLVIRKYLYELTIHFQKYN